MNKKYIKIYDTSTHASIAYQFIEALEMRIERTCLQVPQ